MNYKHLHSFTDPVYFSSLSTWSLYTSPDMLNNHEQPKHLQAFVHTIPSLKNPAPPSFILSWTLKLQIWYQYLQRNFSVTLSLYGLRTSPS